MIADEPNPSAVPGRLLTARQRRFIEAYTAGANGTQAAIRAGYSPRSARVTACRMLTNAMVAAEVQAHRRRREAAADEHLLRIVNQYAMIAFSRVCPADYMVLYPGETPTLRPVEEWTEEMRIMCETARVTAGGVKIVMRCRDKALRVLARYSGGFEH